jgi:formylglycine-generating enzyme required for sulfatase activity
MEDPDFISRIIKYLLENLPELVGGTIVAIIGALILWLVNRFNKNRKIEIEENKTVKTTSVLDDYIGDVIKRSSLLSFGDPSSVHGINSNDSGGFVTLDQIWTPLRVADSQIRLRKQSSHENMTEQNAGEDLIEVYRKSNDSIIILGDPGSGKSTSISLFALYASKDFNKDSDRLFPIWINLSSITNHEESNEINLLLSSVPEIELALKRSGKNSQDELSTKLSNLILNGKALILLDGLDEVKEYNLGIVRKLITYLCSLNNGNRIITSCRKFDYRQVTPNRKVPIQHELELLSYNFIEQKEYVQKWYDAAVRIGRFTKVQADNLRDALIIELKTENLLEIGSSPMLLALLTLIHSEEAKLPDTRAVLCDRAITYMLADSAKWRIREAGVSILASPPVLSLAIEIAYFMHKSEDNKPETNSTISENEINLLAQKLCTEMQEAEIGKAPAVSELIGRFINSHGLLVSVGNGLFKFSHRSFQEFLAGQYFAAGAKKEEAIKNSTSANWIEPYRLMASFAGHDGNNLYYILELIKELAQFKNNIYPIQLAGEMLIEIGRTRLALHKFSYILEKEEGLWGYLKKQILTQAQDPKLKLAERERGASILAGLGDPRFENFFPELLDITQDNVKIGSSKLDMDILANSGVSVGNKRDINLYGFKLSKYLVTNSDFRRFVEDDGYINFDYWKGKYSKGWISGDHLILEEIRQHWLSNVHFHHKKEIRDGEIQENKLIEESFIRTEPRQEPFYWFDKRFNQSNQPVVGVNYWEAEAFCNWLTQKARNAEVLDKAQKFCIPTEFEWERCSRPTSDDRIFPWGDIWDENKAHVSTNLLNMRQPAPVGVYLESWENGPCDMSGNVWEWTKSLFHPFEKSYDHKRIDIDSLDERVVRGSSWYNNSYVAACSSRAVDRSYNLFYDVGFRVVCISEDIERL